MPEPNSLSLVLEFLRDMHALLGAIVGGGIVYFVGERSRRAEDARQRRELGVAIGRSKLEHAERLARSRFAATGVPEYVPSLEACIMAGVRVADVILDTSLSVDQVATRLAELNAFTLKIVQAEKAQCTTHIQD